MSTSYGPNNPNGSIFFEALYKVPTSNNTETTKFWKIFETDRNMANFLDENDNVANKGAFFEVNRIDRGTPKKCLLYKGSTRQVTFGIDDDDHKITYEQIQNAISSSQFVIDNFGNVFIWNGGRGTESKIKIWKNPAFPMPTDSNNVQGFQTNMNPWNPDIMTITYMQTGDPTKLRYREYNGTGIILSSNGLWMFKKDLTQGVDRFYVLYNPINSSLFKKWYEAQPAPSLPYDRRDRNNSGILHKYCEMVATKPSRRDQHPSDRQLNTWTTNGVNDEPARVTIKPALKKLVGIYIPIGLNITSGQTVIVKSRSNPARYFEGIVSSYYNFPRSTDAQDIENKAGKLSIQIGDVKKNNSGVIEYNPIVNFPTVTEKDNNNNDVDVFSLTDIFDVQIRGYSRIPFSWEAGTVKGGEIKVVGTEQQPQMGSDGLRGYGDPLCKYATTKECTATMYGVPNKDYTATGVTTVGQGSVTNTYDTLQDLCMCKSSNDANDGEMGINEVVNSRPNSFMGIVRSDTTREVDRNSLFWRDQYQRLRNTENNCPTTTHVSFCNFNVQSAGDFNMVDSSMSCGSNSSATKPTPFPQNCQVSSFRELTPVEKAKVSGLETNCGVCRTNPTASVTLIKDVLLPQVGAGTPCPRLSELQKSVRCDSSDNVACPVNCVTSEWSAWSNDDASKRAGITTRTKTVRQAAKNNGAECGPTYEPRNLDVDCTVTGWSAPGECDKRIGEKTRTREKIFDKKWNGNTCPPLATQEPCNVDCEMNDWKDDWSACDPATGTQTRTRTVKYQTRGTGIPCDPKWGTETRNCNVDCKVSEWDNNGEFGPCNKSNGKRTRTRREIQRQWNQGAGCPELTQSINCDVDCELGPWKNDGGCINGRQIQRRDTLVEPQNQGRSCQAQGGVERTVLCSDCELNPWVDGECSKTCGGGQKTRTRTIKEEARAGGKPCSDYQLTEVVNCNTQPCPIDCVMNDDWVDEGVCDKECGGGKKKQTRTVKIQPAYGGKECDPKWSTRYVDCNTQPCPVDCKLSEWKDDGKCDKDCGGGKIKQKREVLVKPAHGGKECPNVPMEQEVDCNTEKCPIYKNPIVIGVGVIAVIAAVYYLSTSSAVTAAPLSMKMRK